MRSRPRAREKPKVCDTTVKGPNLEKLQKEAFANYVNLWVTKRDVLTAYNRYVPGYAFVGRGRTVECC